MKHRCEITKYETNQPTHFKNHLKSDKYKKEVKIYELELEKKDRKELKKY